MSNSATAGITDATSDYLSIPINRCFLEVVPNFHDGTTRPVLVLEPTGHTRRIEIDYSSAVAQLFGRDTEDPIACENLQRELDTNECQLVLHVRVNGERSIMLSIHKKGVIAPAVPTRITLPSMSSPGSKNSST